LEAIIDNFSDWIIDTNPDSLKKVFEKMLIDSGFGILNFMDHQFEPQGYTAIYLLSESHFAIHTFPEENKSYIELSSCNRDMYYRFKQLFKKYQSVSA